MREAKLDASPGVGGWNSVGTFDVTAQGFHETHRAAHTGDVHGNSEILPSEELPRHRGCQSGLTRSRRAQKEIGTQRATALQNLRNKTGKSFQDLGLKLLRNGGLEKITRRYAGTTKSDRRKRD